MGFRIKGGVGVKGLGVFKKSENEKVRKLKTIGHRPRGPADALQGDADATSRYGCELVDVSPIPPRSGVGFLGDLVDVSQQASESHL